MFDMVCNEILSRSTLTVAYSRRRIQHEIYISYTQMHSRTNCPWAVRLQIMVVSRTMLSVEARLYVLAKLDNLLDTSKTLNCHFITHIIHRNIFFLLPSVTGIKSLPLCFKGKNHWQFLNEYSKDLSVYLLIQNEDTKIINQLNMQTKLN